MGNRFRGSHPLRGLILFAALALLLPCAAHAARPPTIELLDSDPGPDAIIGIGQPLYLRFRYHSDVPIRILLSGTYRGEIVRGFSHDSEELFPAGRREATVWLAYPRGVRIDHVRVRLWKANMAQLGAAAFPIRAQWADVSETAGTGQRVTKSWVAELTPAQHERMSAQMSASESFDPFALIFLCMPGYFLLQAALTYWTSGGWRKASLAPAVIMVPILAYTVLAFAAQSNLWPLLLILTAPLAFAYLVFLTAILLLRRLARAT